jgi:hypothetical protein
MQSLDIGVLICGSLRKLNGVRWRESIFVGSGDTTALSNAIAPSAANNHYVYDGERHRQ